MIFVPSQSLDVFMVTVIVYRNKKCLHFMYISKCGDLGSDP